MSSSTLPICPQCGQSDKVQKVSEAYREAQAAVKAAGKRAAADQAALARRLAPPPSAAAPHTKWGLVLAVVVLVLGGLAFAAGVTDERGPSVRMLLNAAILLIGGVIFLALELSGKARAARQVRADIIARWQRAFYCARCDCAFLADNTATRPPG